MGTERGGGRTRKTDLGENERVLSGRERESLIQERERESLIPVASKCTSLLSPPPSRYPSLSQEFVDKAKWAHLDIAGPVWDDAKGATGIQLLKSPLRSDFFCTVNILGEGEGGPLLLLGVNK
jgi:hypothetical protein